MTNNEALEFIDRNHWIKAKTAIRNPHEYLVRQKVKDDKNFEAFIGYIRSHPEAFNESFWKVVYRAVKIGPYKYWTQGYPQLETTIINRAIFDADKIRYTDRQWDKRTLEQDRQEAAIKKGYIKGQQNLW